VPLGSTEQHGPHLPLDTDTRIAIAWARAVADAIPGALLAPAVPYGSAGEHQAFPGTLSIGQAALEQLVVELVRSAAGQVDATALLSGHGGNHEPVTRAVDQLRTEGHRVTAFFPSWDQARWPIGAVDAHAGRTETSLLLHLAPAAVRTDRLEQGATEPVDDLMDRMRAGGTAAVSPNGVLGDPRGASAAEGRLLLDDLAARTVTALRDRR
jgi:creatinine amidohydrolase